jgi:teichoic acid transport system permease protein
MWERRRLATALPMEELRSSHKDTLLGNMWHLGNPLLSVAVYYFVFDTLLGASRGVDNFILWLTVGLFTYTLTSSTVTGGARAIDQNRSLMRGLRFPRALIPISVVVSVLLTFMFELSILAVLAIVTGEQPSWRWLILPAIIGGHTCFNLGGAFIAARLNDSFRDIQQILPFIFQLLRYTSGVIFPLELFLDDNESVPGFLRFLLKANPVRNIIECYRWVFLGRAETGAAYLIGTFAVSLLLLIGGFVIFRRGEQRYGLR